MLLIYTPMAGGLAEEALNGLVMLIGSGTFHTALNIAMTLGVGAMSYQYITGKKLESIMRFTIMSFAVLFVLIGIRVPVGIIDMQDPMQTHEVDDVPAGVAIPAAFISQVGRGIAQVFDDVFHMPDEMAYNQTGMVFGSRIALAASSADFGMSPELSTDLSNYMRQCIWIGKVQVDHGMSVSEMVHSTNLMTYLFSNPSKNYRVILEKQGNVSCADAAKYLQQQLVNAAKLEEQRLANKFTDGKVTTLDSRLSTAQQQFMGVSHTGTDLLVQNMLINKVRNSVADAMAFSGNTASMMNYANTSSMNNLRIAEANTFWMAGYRLPMLDACLWILIMCLFPVIILMGFFPVFKKAYTGFIYTMVWLWMWPPMFTIINFFVSYYASTKTNIFGEQDGGITMSNVHPLNMIHSDMALTAGAIALLVPFLSQKLATGLAAGFASLSQIVGGMTQSISHSVAGSLSHGNVSVAQFSGWNANYDNTNAHKHDINYTDYRNTSQVQQADGSIVGHTASGLDYVNTSSVISHLAVAPQGTQAVTNSLTHSAQEAHHRADQLRTSADQSFNSALREGEQYMNSHANDYRSGAGISKNDSYGINQDYRQMRDALHDWNAGHDGSHQVTWDQAMHAKWDSSDQALGKLGKLATGVSVGGGTNLRHSHSQTESLKEFMSSKEGQSFSQSYNHAISTAKNIHMDGSTSHNLSGAEQSAVDLVRAQGLSQQASTEYSIARNYSDAASRAESNSTSINTNFANNFVAWAKQTHGREEALHILGQTEGAGLHIQQQWVNQYLASSEGKSFVGSEVGSMLKDTQHNVSTGKYQSQQASLVKTSNVAGHYQEGKDQIQERVSTIHSLSKPQQEQASALAAQARSSHLMKQSTMVQSQVLDHSHRLNNQISQTTDQTQGKVKQEFEHGVVMGDAKSAAASIGEGMIKLGKEIL